MKKVILYGCGCNYRGMSDYLKYCRTKKRLDILGISDKNLPPGKFFDSWPLIPREKIREYPYDYIFITSEAYEQEIREELLAMGISEKAFDMNLRNYRYDRMLSGISIICNNCWGGIAAHTLGIECCSPTKNLYFDPQEFLVFLGDLEYYLSLDPVMAGWRDALTRYDVSRFPILKVGDIKLYCNHDTDPDEAIEKWQRRKKKVDLKNMVAVFSTSEPAYEKAFFEIGGIPARYSLVPFRSVYPHSLQIDVKEGQQWFEASIATAYPGGCLDLAGMMRNEDTVIIKEVFEK